MKSVLKSRYFIIIATLCLILCILAVALFGIDRVRQREIYYDYSAKVDSRGLYLEGYEQNGDKIIAKGDDCYIYLPVTDMEINDVRIVFNSKYSSSEDIKLEYVCKNSVQNTENYVISRINSGSKEIYFTLNTDVYTVLKCHIPGSFEIKEIVLSHITSQNIVTKTEFNLPLLIAGGTVLLGLYTALLILRKKTK